MIFTDDDLRSLEDYTCGSDTTWFDGFTVGRIKALVARLKAAENAMSDDCECYEIECYHEKAYEAWRKAAGK